MNDAFYALLGFAGFLALLAAVCARAGLLRVSVTAGRQRRQPPKEGS